MSELDPTRTTRQRRDRGMTLPELLISITVIGLVVTVLSAGVTVTMRQHSATQGRLDVARWEQNLGSWLPDDLNSASTVSGDPAASPCAASTCGDVDMSAGSNVLLLTWTDDTVTTTVSYRYQPDRAGTFGLFRVECEGATCTSLRVLGDLAAPSGAWGPGQPVPDDVIDVDYPAAAGVTEQVDCETLPEDDPLCDRSEGPRLVTVTVNGIPADDGTDRSTRINLNVGGTDLSPLPRPNFATPSFDRAESDCGGPITLIVDRSGSIGDDMQAVKEGVARLVNVLDGTPTQLQIIHFADTAQAMGADVNGNHYYDLSEPGVASGLTAAGGPIDSLQADGGTNWEDALYRTFYDVDSGKRHDQTGNPAVPLPELVMFFTDGMPTQDRIQSGAVTAADPPPTRFSPTVSYSPGNKDVPFTGATRISPRAWYRAEQVVNGLNPESGAGNTDVRIIGLGVGKEFKLTRYMRKNNKWTSPIITGWDRGAPIPHAEFLGDLITGGDASDPSDNSYVTREWNDAVGWGDDLDAVDLLVASNFDKFADALAAIVLEKCGGTLTVQTRIAAGQPDAGQQAQFDLTHQLTSHQGSTFVTTSRIAKSGTFDVAMAGLPERSVVLVPDTADLVRAGYRATGWACRAKGQDLVPGTDFEVNEGDPAKGITIDVRASAAVSCTLEVAP